MKTRKVKSQKGPPPEPRVLSIPEIIVNICHFIDLSDSAFDVENVTTVLQKRAALLNVARVAKRFTNPALSFLWAEQHGLAALLRTFGPTVIDELADEKLFFRSVPNNDAWERFQFYAGFVQNFYLTPEYLHMSTLPILGQCHGYLLPNLRKLVVMDWPADQLGSISMFFGPSLHAFRFKRPLSQHLVHMLEEPLRRLVLVSPTLSILQVVLEPLEGDERMELGGALRSFAHLTNVDLPIVGILAHDVLCHLANIPCLHHAYFRISQAANIDVGRSRVKMPLTSLNVQGSRDGVQGLFKAFSFGRVRKIIVVPPAAGGGDLLNLSSLAYLAHACPNIDELTLDQRNEPMSASLDDDLSPLLRLAKLQVFRVWTGFPVYLWGNQLLRIPLAYPSLRVFDVFRPTSIQSGSAVRQHLASILTLWQLVMFTSRCPQLTEITMPLDAMQIPVVPLEPMYNVKLLTIAAHYSPINHPDAVASFLSSAFPDAKLVLTSYVHGGRITTRKSCLKEWNAVLALMKIINRARREEKQRARREAALAESGKITLLEASLADALEKVAYLETQLRDAYLRDFAEETCPTPVDLDLPFDL